MRWGPVFVLVSAALAAAPAHAAEPDKAMAEALFQSGRTLLDEGKVEEACQKLAASQHIEPKLGTLLNLAVCHEKLGRTATAWAEFAEAEAQAERTEQRDRADLAREHIGLLEKKLSKIVLVGETAPSTLKLDDRVIDPSVVGTAIPLDPGPHVLEASALAKQPWSTHFVAAVGPAEQTLRVPRLIDAAVTPTTDVPPPVSPSKSRARTVATWTAIGIGVVGVGIGTYAGLRSFSLKSDAEGECTGSACSSAGLARWDDVKTMADVATVSFIVAGAALALGTWLLVSSPPSGASRTAATR